jgi:hypothetical protein
VFDVERVSCSRVDDLSDEDVEGASRAKRLNFEGLSWERSQWGSVGVSWGSQKGRTVNLQYYSLLPTAPTALYPLLARLSRLLISCFNLLVCRLPSAVWWVG